MDVAEKHELYGISQNEDVSFKLYISMLVIYIKNTYESMK